MWCRSEGRRVKVLADSCIMCGGGGGGGGGRSSLPLAKVLWNSVLGQSDDNLLMVSLMEGLCAGERWWGGGTLPYLACRPP